MILTCPNCGTQYVVKDGAIPPEGRQVRCAACKHSWHQDPQEAAAEPVTASEPLLESSTDEAMETQAEEENFAEATLIDPRSGPEAEERAYEEAVLKGESPNEEESDVQNEQALGGDAGTATLDRGQSPQDIPDGDGPRVSLEEGDARETPPVTQDWNAPPTAEPVSDTFSPFAEDGEVEPRRRSPLGGILAIVLVIIVVAALFWFLAPPALKAKLGIGAAAATPLQLITTHMDRTPLESGNELLTVTGRVINPSPKEQDVPPIQAQLKSRSGKLVYSWTIQPPAHSLAAGASASFNSAEVNVPPGGDELTITLGEPKA